MTAVANRASPIWPLLVATAAVTVHAPTVLAALTAAPGRLAPLSPASASSALNVLLHATVSALVWYAVRAVSTHYGTALIAATLFAVHPLQSATLFAAAGRVTLIGCALALGSWLVHRGMRARARAAVLSGALYFASLLADPALLAAPALFLLDDALREPRGRQRHAIVAGLVRYGTALALAAVLLSFGPLGRSPEVRADFGAAGVERVTAGLDARLDFALRFLAAGIVDSPPAQFGGPLGWLLAAAALALLIYGCRRSRPIALGVVAWIALPLPWNGDGLGPPTYAAAFGACLIAGHAAAALVARVRGPRKRRATASIIILVSAWALVGAGTLNWLEAVA